MATLVIPLTNVPIKEFTIDLDGNTYRLDLHWNIVDAAWYMNLSGITNDVLINGIKLVTGPNLLKPYAQIELGAIYMVDESEQQLDADFDTIGIDVQMYYVEKADVDSII
jgi:hypothetical protein